MERAGNWTIYFLIFSLSRSFAQDTVNVKEIEQYDFIKWDDNEIINSTSLSRFYEKLYQLKNGKKGTVNIVHIGDSHIQADLLTHTARQLIQKEFGNAGRGFIFPGRLARTNEPQNIHSSSNAVWDAKRIVFTDQLLPIGLGASTVRTKQPGAKFVLRTADSPGLDYSFINVMLFYQKDVAGFNLILMDSTGSQLAYAGPYTNEVYPNYSAVTLPYKVHQVEFQTVQPTNKQDQFTLFGISVSNGNPGILYHSIGGNGAKFKHYLAAQFFVEQTKALNPDLIIISLGTNEANEYPYIDKQFTEQAETFVSKLKQSNPDAVVVITTPADFYRKRTRRNAGVEQIHTQLVQLAEKKSLACWDLYMAGGGKHSADQWKKNNLMQKDGVHFTKAGYELQGNMLYQALMNGYKEYVHYRYP
jgi:lysophospholipase L1-like esterase